MQKNNFQTNVIYTFTKVDEVKDFQIINGNRTINKAHAEKIKRAMASAISETKRLLKIR